MGSDGTTLLDLRIRNDEDERAAADAILDGAQRAVAAQGPFTPVLPGGLVPEKTDRILATRRAGHAARADAAHDIPDANAPLAQRPEKALHPTDGDRTWLLAAARRPAD